MKAKVRAIRLFLVIILLSVLGVWGNVNVAFGRDIVVGAAFLKIPKQLDRFITAGSAMNFVRWDIGDTGIHGWNMRGCNLLWLGALKIYNLEVSRAMGAYRIYMNYNIVKYPQIEETYWYKKEGTGRKIVTENDEMVLGAKRYGDRWWLRMELGLIRMRYDFLLIYTGLANVDVIRLWHNKALTFALHNLSLEYPAYKTREYLPAEAAVGFSFFSKLHGQLSFELGYVLPAYKKVRAYFVLWPRDNFLFSGGVESNIYDFAVFSAVKLKVRFFTVGFGIRFSSAIGNSYIIEVGL